eukprot:164439-Alexandrium_andersonii.AAC.1
MSAAQAGIPSLWWPWVSSTQSQAVLSGWRAVGWPTPPRPRLVAGPFVVRTPTWSGGEVVAGSWRAAGRRCSGG